MIKNGELAAAEVRMTYMRGDGARAEQKILPVCGAKRLKLPLEGVIGSDCKFKGLQTVLRNVGERV